MNAQLDRDKLRALQDRCSALADRLNLDNQMPISSVQVDAPTIADLRRCIYPGFESSMRSFLEHFFANDTDGTTCFRCGRYIDGDANDPNTCTCEPSGADSFDEPNGSENTVSNLARRYSAQWGLPKNRE